MGKTSYAIFLNANQNQLRYVTSWKVEWVRPVKMYNFLEM